MVSGDSQQNGAVPRVDNCVIAGNHAGTQQGQDYYNSYPIIDAGYNLIGKTDGSNGFTQASDILGSNAQPKDPLLDPAGPTNHGGPTLTIGLQNGSPAFQNGDPLFKGPVNVDQRGYPRPNTQVTIGAYDPGATAANAGGGAMLTPTSTFVGSSADPSVPNQTISLTATVIAADAGTPSGTVTFLDNGSVLGTANLSPTGGGSDAVFTISSGLSLGDYLIIAQYSGDDNYEASSSTVFEQIVSVASSTALTSSANPSTPGQSVTFTATVTASDGGTPTGVVWFYDGDSPLGSATLDGTGTATLATSNLSLGTHIVTAYYDGDDTYAPSQSSPLTQTVQQAAGTTYLSSSIDPSVIGQPVTFTAVVSSSSGFTPTGTVAFYNGATPLGTATLDDTGTATFTTSDLPLGDNPITAVYDGDANNAGSTSNVLDQVVQLAGTQTTLSSDLDPSAPGQTVTFTATVTSLQGGTPTGTVSFYNGGTLLGTSTLDNAGTATFTTSNLPSGDNLITAVYSGDASNAASTSPTLTQAVLYSTSTSLASSANPSVAGIAVTFTASVSSAGGTPTGLVYFFDGPTLLGTGALVNGAATFTTSSLSVGDHSMTAFYGGDGFNAGSGSGVLTQTVQLATTTTSLSSNADPASVGQAVTFTATVTTSGGDAPTGVVYFYDGTTLLGTGTVVNGVATFTTSSLSQGNHTITAVYGGDDANAGSDSDPLTEIITGGGGGGGSQPPPPPH